MFKFYFSLNFYQLFWLLHMQFFLQHIFLWISLFDDLFYYRKLLLWWDVSVGLSIILTLELWSFSEKFLWRHSLVFGDLLTLTLLGKNSFTDFATEFLLRFLVKRSTLYVLKSIRVLMCILFINMQLNKSKTQHVSNYQE